MHAKINHTTPTRCVPQKNISGSASTFHDIELRISDFVSLDSLWLYDSKRLLHLLLIYLPQNNISRLSRHFSLFSSGIDSTFSGHKTALFAIHSNKFVRFISSIYHVGFIKYEQIKSMVSFLHWFTSFYAVQKRKRLKDSIYLDIRPLKDHRNPRHIHRIAILRHPFYTDTDRYECHRNFQSNHCCCNCTTGNQAKDLRIQTVSN